MIKENKIVNFDVLDLELNQLHFQQKSRINIFIELNEKKNYVSKDEDRCECGLVTWACKYPACKAGR